MEIDNPGKITISFSICSVSKKISSAPLWRICVDAEQSTLRYATENSKTYNALIPRKTEREPTSKSGKEKHALYSQSAFTPIE
jgi:hypothetical protein